MLTLSSLITVCCLLLYTNMATAELYEWRNDDGSTGFTDDISRVPPKHRKTLTKKDSTDFPVNTTDSTKDVPKQDISASDEKMGNEMTEQQKEEADRQMKATWQHLKDSLSGIKGGNR